MREADAAAILPLVLEDVSLRAPGEQVCGDGWAFAVDGALSSVIVADGLGHGPDAAEASEAALEVFASDDFREGVRAAVIDKDRNPKWSPPRIEDVTPQMVAPYFAEIGADELKFN